MGMTDEEANLHDTLSSIKEHLRSKDSAKIVLIGDVMMDCYIHGFANNLNSRAPVPVLRETSREEDVGAAAHVARGLRAMGLPQCRFVRRPPETRTLGLEHSRCAPFRVGHPPKNLNSPDWGRA